MKKIYGIDLGTTYSAIATKDENGHPVIIENQDEGTNNIASVVYFQDIGDPVIGEVAKNMYEAEPTKVVQYVKRQIGKEDSQIYKFGGKDYDPITISALIIKQIVKHANDQGHDVKDVVITCPASFGYEERTATKQAGEIAGLNVLNIINEPTAAALKYCYRELQINSKIMVYDLGGGTFDLTVFNMTVDVIGIILIDVLFSDGDEHLGGID
jgi:molecular chaperone DnaK (HSP70)